MLSLLSWPLTALALGAPAGALPMNYAGSTTIGADYDPHWASTWFSHAIDRHNGVGLSVQFLPSHSDHGNPGSNGNPLFEGNDDAAAPEGSHARQGQESFALVDWTRLVQRWNMPNAQANLWLVGGVGIYYASGSSQPVSFQQGLENPNRHPGGLAMGMGPMPGMDGAMTMNPAEPSLRLAASPGIQVDVETTRLRLEGRGRLFLAPGIQRSQLSATGGVALTPARYDGIQPWLELQVRAMPGVIDGVELIPKIRLLQRRLVLEAGYSSRGSVVGGFTFTL